jgi:hypothetical protein
MRLTNVGVQLWRVRNTSPPLHHAAALCNLSGNDLVLECIRIETVDAALRAFRLRIHQEWQRLTPYS